jgi:hypothetical protein
VVHLKLDAPFKYNVDPSEASKRKFSIIVRWFFMMKGLLRDGVGGDYQDYCKRFFDALKTIDAGQRADKELAQNGNSNGENARKTPMTVEESQDLDEARNMYSLRSAQRVQYPERLAAGQWPLYEVYVRQTLTSYRLVCRFCREGISEGSLALA